MLLCLGERLGKREMVLLKNLNKAFIHIPKTGGIWVREVLAKLEGISLLHRHAALTETKEVCPGILTFTFVRHPLSWYRSYWMAHRSFMEGVDQHTDTFFFRPQANGRLILESSYSKFVERCIEECPGFLVGLYSRYWGADQVGRYENLEADLTQFLGHSLPYTEPKNVSPGSRPELSKLLEEKLLLSEKEILDRYYI